jgi:hypothetical protein
MTEHEATKASIAAAALRRCVRSRVDISPQQIIAHDAAELFGEQG